MKYLLPQPLLDRWFQVVVIIKGFDGLLELIGGLLVLYLPLATIHDLIASLVANEIQTDPHAFIANAISHLDHQLTPGLRLFAAIYLVAHGTIKVFLVSALLSRRYHYYPIAMAFLVAFIGYQVYRIGVDHSVVLTLLTLLDCVVVWLTYLEWRRHRPDPSSLPGSS